MAEPKEIPLMEKIVSLCKRRGFIFQSSEIYGGINGVWDYGPLGAELKRNVKELWWNTLTRQRDDVAGLEATIIMSPEIWKASGHVATFADMMRECPMTKKRVRADQVEPQSGMVYSFAGALKRQKQDSYEDYYKFIPGALERWAKRAGRSFNFLTLQEFTEELFEVMLRNKGLQSENQIREFAGNWARGLWDKIEIKPFRVLIPFGKPRETAIKLARQFYASKEWPWPLPIESRDPENITDTTDFHPESGVELVESLGRRDPEKVESTIDFHPESGVMLEKARPFNLMFKTYVGPIESEEGIAYLRPETAQAIFAQFKNVLETSRQKVPFGIAQVGKAFRNEVTPRNFTFRSREFEQMELEFFIRPDEATEALYGSVATVPPQGHPGEPQPNWGWQAWHQYWVEERVRFYENIGLPRTTLGFHIQQPDELAHYARATTDILYKFPFSKSDDGGEVKGDELEGIAARGDFDLGQHEKHSGKLLTVFDEELRAAWTKLAEERKQSLREEFIESKTRVGIEKKKLPPGDAAEAARKEAEIFFDRLAKGQFLPHVIEPSAGLDRLTLALISNAYSEVTNTDDKGKSETRVIMKFHPRVAPIKAGVFPLLKNKPELVRKAQEIRDLLRPHMNVFYDDGGAIGRRYARQDEAGTPYCLTIDFDTLGENPELLDTVTLRYRDDGRQERLHVSQLVAWLQERVR